MRYLNNSISEPNISKQRLLSLALAMLAVLLIAFLMGCSGKRPPTKAIPQDDFEPIEVRPQQLYKAGLDEITKNYIYEPNAAVLTFAGIQHLADIDENLVFHIQSGEEQTETRQLLISSRSNSGLQKSLDLPQDSSTETLAKFTQSAVKQAKAVSVKLKESDDERIFAAVYDGYMSKLDANSRYWTPVQAKILWEQLLGFGGIGINFELSPLGIKVNQVVNDSPAQLAGLRTDDLITAIDGVPLDDNRTRDSLIEKLRGPIGSKVRLDVQRGTLLKTIILQRQEIVPPTVRWQIKDDVLELRITNFASKTADETLNAIMTANRQSGGQLKGLIIDLRDNPGGLLPAATAISNLFLTRGLITRTIGRAENANRTFVADKNELLPNTPIIIVVNSNSASASEIISSALQDNDRALIIGSSTFGKGSVQTNLKLPNNGRMSLTIAEFYGPDDLPLNHVGISPTLCTTDADMSPSERIVKLINGDLRSNLPIVKRILSMKHKNARQEVLQICPENLSQDPADIELAHLLIRTPQLYDKIIQDVKIYPVSKQ